jgi:lipoate-protein ligase A
MPAKSVAQQRFMGMVHALQKGDIKPSDVSDKIKDTAKSISKKAAKDYAETGHKGLPQHVENYLREEIKNIFREEFKRKLQSVNESDSFQKDKEIASSLMKAKDMFEKALKTSTNSQAKAEIQKKLDDIDKIVKKMIQRK